MKKLNITIAEPRKAEVMRDRKLSKQARHAFGLLCHQNKEVRRFSEALLGNHCELIRAGVVKIVS